MIYIYQANTREIRANKKIETLLLELPKSMHTRALRYKREEDGYNFVVGRLLLKKGLKELGQAEKLEDIQFSKEGKPYLKSVSFNISHSNDLVVCALTKKGEIGIDIEKNEAIDLNNFKSYFMKNEWDTINQSKNPMLKFYWYWTRKESIIKALGVNLSYLHKIELDAEKDYFENDGKHWYLKNIDFGKSYTGVLCCEADAEFTLREGIDCR